MLSSKHTVFKVANAKNKSYKEAFMFLFVLFANVVGTMCKSSDVTCYYCADYHEQRLMNFVITVLIIMNGG